MWHFSVRVGTTGTIVNFNGTLQTSTYRNLHILLIAPIHICTLAISVTHSKEHFYEPT